MKDETYFEGMSNGDRRRVALEYALRMHDHANLLKNAESILEYLTPLDTVSEASITNRHLKRIAESLEAKR